MRKIQVHVYTTPSFFGSLLLNGLQHYYYPARMRRGKKNRFCLSVVVVTKIARSRILGICACCDYHELVDIGEKVVSVRSELLNMAHYPYKSCIFRSACLWFTDCTHSTC